MISEVHNMDCIELMARYPDKHFDLAVVDPPYGYGNVVYMPRERLKAHGGFLDRYEITIAAIDSNNRRMNKVEVVHAQTSKNTIRSFSEENVSPPPAYFDELFRISKNQIIWGGNYFLLPPSRGFIIWRKTSVAESFSMAMAEYAWISYDMNAKVFECAPQGTKNDPRMHPTQKPIKLYDWIFANYAKPGQLILDTHLGSGSSRIAADRAGLNFIGCELDADYFAAHEKRWNEYKAQLKLL